MSAAVNPQVIGEHIRVSPTTGPDFVSARLQVVADAQGARSPRGSSPGPATRPGTSWPIAT
jgi:hypothetical protein